LSYRELRETFQLPDGQRRGVPAEQHGIITSIDKADTRPRFMFWRRRKMVESVGSISDDVHMH